MPDEHSDREQGPVQTLRLLALRRREPFDYQEWRRMHFAGLTVEELFRQMRELEKARS